MTVYPMPYGKVLIVDDVETNLYIAEGLLIPYELKIETVTSGYEAIEKIEGGGIYDVVFMDHMMPHMDGIETTQKLRAMGYTGVIVALTSSAAIGKDGMFRQNGFDAFVSKPIDTRELNAVLNKFVRRTHTVCAAVPKKRAERPAADSGPLARLRAIDGLDVDSALEAMGGVYGVYTGAVGLMARLMPETVKRMDLALAEGDARAFAVEIHGLRSVLKSIGASELSGKAGRLEADAAKGVICDGTYPSFKSSLARFLQKIRTALPERECAGGQADIAAVASAAGRAKAAAEIFDSISALELLSPFAGSSLGGGAERLLDESIRALEVFDCESACKKIIKLEEIICGRAEERVLLPYKGAYDPEDMRP